MRNAPSARTNTDVCIYPFAVSTRKSSTGTSRVPSRWNGKRCGIGKAYSCRSSIRPPAPSIRPRTNPSVVAFRNVYTIRPTAIAVSRNGRSAWGIWAPKGGFIKTVSTDSRNDLTSPSRHPTSAPTRSAFRRATSTARGSVSRPMTRADRSDRAIAAPAPTGPSSYRHPGKGSSLLVPFGLLLERPRASRGECSAEVRSPIPFDRHEALSFEAIEFGFDLVRFDAPQDLEKLMLLEAEGPSLLEELEDPGPQAAFRGPSPLRSECPIHDLDGHGVEGVLDELSGLSGGVGVR